MPLGVVGKPDFVYPEGRFQGVLSAVTPSGLQQALSHHSHVSGLVRLARAPGSALPATPPRRFLPVRRSVPSLLARARRVDARAVALAKALGARSVRHTNMARPVTRARRTARVVRTAARATTSTDSDGDARPSSFHSSLRQELDSLRLHESSFLRFEVP